MLQDWKEALVTNRRVSVRFLVDLLLPVFRRILELEVLLEMIVERGIAE